MGINGGIKGVLLDLDNTLYEYAVCNDNAKEAVFSLLSQSLKIEKATIEKEYGASRSEIHKRLGQIASSHSRYLYIKECIENVTGKIDLELTKSAADIFWNTYYKSMTLYPDALNFLKKIHSKNIKVAIVTDLLTHIQSKKIVQLGIDLYIDVLVSSEEAGVEKPHPNIYKLALKKLGCKPVGTIMIGDDYAKDVEGAKACGIRGIHIDRNSYHNKGESDSVKNFDEILDLII